MTARSLHEIATGKTAKAHRTGQPVRRNSKKLGSFETRYWSRFDPAERNARMRAAEMHDRATKQKGMRNGALGHVALEVLREMMRIIDFKTGRLEPAIETICARIGRSKDAVTKAMARLKGEGFLDWTRRVEPIENPDPFGPQIRQATNAYVLTLPKAAADLVRRLLRRPTEVQRDAAHARDVQARAHVAASKHDTAEQVAEAIAADTPIGRALRSCGAALDRMNASQASGKNPTLQGEG